MIYCILAVYSCFLGDYGKALRYHQSELALSSASGNLLDEGVAHRKVGECLCELGQFDAAAEHQKSHLQLSRRLSELVGGRVWWCGGLDGWMEIRDIHLSVQPYM